MNLRHLTFAAIGLGAAAAVACGSGTTLNVTPAAAVKATPSAQTAAGCDAGRWTGAISPEGRPDAFDAGDTGALYIWHDGDGWHIRATDQRPTDHHYSGVIRLSSNAAFTDVHPVRDEKDDRVVLGGDNTVRYDFHTFASIDGADFRVSCPTDRKGALDHERLSFHTMFDGRPAADRVRIGDAKAAPTTASFAFVRP